MNSDIVAAKKALAAGDRQQALLLLRDLVSREPGNIHGWLYLAAMAPNARARDVCLRRAERLDPEHPLLQRARQWAAAAGPAGGGTASQPVEQPAGDAIVAALRPDAPSRPPPPPAATSPPAGVAKSAALRRSLWLVATAAVLLLLLGGGTLLIWQSLPGPALPSEPVAGGLDVAVAEVAAVEVAALTPGSPAPISGADERYVNADRRLLDVPPDASSGDLPGKAIIAGDEARQPWTATPSPTHTPTPTPTPTATPTIPPTFVSQAANVVRPVFLGPNEKWIDVNLSTQTLNAYEGNKLVFSTLVSSGLPQYPTVTGQFRIYLEYESQTMDGRYLGYDYYLENVPYVMYFYQDYALHGTYWHNNFGNPMSHGCVNMETSDAAWIFGWAGLGTLVNVHY